MNIASIASLIGSVAVIGAVFTWVAYAEQAHGEHAAQAEERHELRDAVRQLQDFELRRQTREEIEQEQRAEHRAPSVSTAPPSRSTTENEGP